MGGRDRGMSCRTCDADPLVRGFYQAILLEPLSGAAKHMATFMSRGDVLLLPPLPERERTSFSLVDLLEDLIGSELDFACV